MTERPTIGEFEELVLLSILQVGEGAYGVPILDEIRRRTGRDVLRPAVWRCAWKRWTGPPTCCPAS